MNTPLGLGDRNTLYTMAARFELHPGKYRLTLESYNDLFVASELGFTRREQFAAPASALGIAQVHPEHVAGKKSRLITTRACPNFQQHIAMIVGIFWKHQGFEELHFLLHVL